MYEPDFGFVTSWVVDEHGRHEPIEMRAKAIAPDLTLHEFVQIFTKAEKQARDGDSYSADPSKWPVVRGVTAVIDALYDAIDKGGYEITRKP